MRPKKLETSVSRNILSILVGLSTETELHQNGHGRRWYEVRQISAICIQLDIFGESHFDLFFFFFFFFLWEASIFSCSSLNIQFHSDIIVVQLGYTVYIWIVLKSKVISAQRSTGTGKSLSEALLFAEYGENTMCTEIDIQNNFCTQNFLPIFCKKKSFWQRFTCNVKSK